MYVNIIIHVRDSTVLLIIVMGRPVIAIVVSSVFSTGWPLSRMCGWTYKYLATYIISYKSDLYVKIISYKLSPPGGLPQYPSEWSHPITPQVGSPNIPPSDLMQHPSKWFLNPDGHKTWPNEVLFWTWIDTTLMYVNIIIHDRDSTVLLIIVMGRPVIATA